MGKLYVASVGFEAGNVLKPLLRVGVSDTDKIILVYTLSDAYSIKRVRSALSDIRKYLEAGGLELEELIVTGSNLIGDAIKVARAVLDAGKYDEVLFILSGGMRIVIISCIIAGQVLSTVRGIRVSYYFMREDGVYDVTVGPDAFSPASVSPRERDIISYIAGHGGSAPRSSIVDSLRKRLGVSRVYIYRVLGRLEEKGLVEVTDSTVALTPVGRLVASIIGEEI